MLQQRNQPANPVVGTNNVILSQAQFEELLVAATRAVQSVGSNSKTVTKFALTSALVHLDSPIDFSTSKGNKLNKAAIEALPLKFDMDPITIHAFNKVLMDRCIASGWNSSTADELIISTQEGHRNLIKDFGRISLEEVKAHCATYIQDETRQAQHQYQLYQCLMNSLTETARFKIVKESH